MLPASFHVPFALLLLVAGFIACFGGYRLFRFLLGVYGFILGALFASSLVPAGNTPVVIVAAVVGGVIGGAVLTFAYFVAVALLGAGAGVMIANAIWTGPRIDSHQLIVIAFAIAGAALAFAFQRYMIIIGTAFGGAWTVVVAGLALMGDRAAAKVAADGANVWSLSSVSPTPGRPGILIAWLVLGLLGVVVQVGATAGPDRRRKRK